MHRTLNVVGQSGAHSKKPRVVRGSERLKTRLSELAGLVLAGIKGFETSIKPTQQLHEVVTGCYRDMLR